MFASRLLSLSPKLSRDGDRIIVRTNRFLWLLTLGLWSRKVWIEPSRKQVRIETRSCWFRRRRQRIGFGSIDAITYGYEDLSVSQHLSWAHDSFDSFRVGLRFVDQSEQHLFTFYGAGTFQNNSPLPDWCYWEDYAFDQTGTQEADSRLLVDLLGEMVGVSVSPPRDY